MPKKGHRVGQSAISFFVVKKQQKKDAAPVPFANCSSKKFILPAHAQPKCSLKTKKNIHEQNPIPNRYPRLP